MNLDAVALPGVEVVVDLERATLPFDGDSVVEIHASHVLEHVDNALGLMQELHRIAKPDAVATFRCPYGATDEDPTHVRRYDWRAVKPIRAPRRELQPEVIVRFATRE